MAAILAAMNTIEFSSRLRVYLIQLFLCDCFTLEDVNKTKADGWPPKLHTGIELAA